MADQGKGLKKDVAGVPGWIWLVGAGVVVVGYLYLRNQSSSGSGSTQATTGTSTGATTSLIPFTDITKTITKTTKHPKKGKTKNTSPANG